MENSFGYWNCSIHPQCATTPGIVICTTLHRELHKFQPFRHKLDKQKIPLKPIFVAEDQHLHCVQNNENYEWRSQTQLLTESQLIETTVEESATAYAPLNRQMHRV